MPELPLSGTALDGFAVWVAMLRPREDPIPHLKRADAALAREVALAIDQEGGGKGWWSPVALLRAEPMERWRQEMLHGSFGGAVAGDFLMRLLELKEHAPQLASSNRAHHILMQDFADASLGNRRPAPKSPKTIWNGWAQFRPAAHMWGSAPNGFRRRLAKGPGTAVDLSGARRGDQDSSGSP